MGVGDPVTRAGTDKPARDTYIVHVYRRSDEPGQEIAGLVESVDLGEPLAFKGRDELWAALAKAPEPRPRKSARRPPATGQ